MNLPGKNETKRRHGMTSNTNSADAEIVLAFACGQKVIIVRTAATAGHVPNIVILAPLNVDGSFDDVVSEFIGQIEETEGLVHL
jgi:hypothetical protein